jgi:hypothetical protein
MFCLSYVFCSHSVDVSVFDIEGRRHRLRGKEGQSLVELLAEHEDSLGGDGAALYYSHKPTPCSMSSPPDMHG